MSEEDIIVAVGDEVTHATFGKGVVKSVETHEDGETYAHIHFYADDPALDRMFKHPLGHEWFIDPHAPVAQTAPAAQDQAKPAIDE